MAEKDIISKTLESYNDVFADILNVFLFDGEQVVLPEELSPADIFSQYKISGKLHGQERDVSKQWKNSNSFCIALVGYENQTAVDKYMPLRVMNYDSADYRKQLSAEKVERVYPVVTLVLYFGNEKWKRYTTLHECVDMPEKLKPYVSDYKINVFDMHDLTDSQISKFKSDFKQIALYYKSLFAGQDYSATADPLKHPRELVDFFEVFRKDTRFTDSYNSMNEKGDVNMCELLDKIEARGEARGEAKGRAQGVADMLEQLRRLGVDEAKLQQAANAVKQSV